jgi:hypothetical protein
MMGELSARQEIADRASRPGAVRTARRRVRSGVSIR